MPNGGVPELVELLRMALASSAYAIIAGRRIIRAGGVTTDDTMVR